MRHHSRVHELGGVDKPQCPIPLAQLAAPAGYTHTAQHKCKHTPVYIPRKRPSQMSSQELGFGSRGFWLALTRGRPPA
eukprot:3180296-Prymnesium_polylepis.2